MKRSQSSIAPVRRRFGRIGAWLLALVTVASAVTACTITTDPPSTTNPPTVTVSSPTDGTSTSQAQIDVSGILTWSEPINSVHVTNGSYSDSCFVSSDQFICTGVELTIGSNTISVRATDDEGRFGRDEVTVNRGDDLTASIDQITDTSTADANQVLLEGSFSSPSDVTSVSVSSDVGSELSCTVGTDATYSCPGVTISTGLTRLQVIVSNQNGDDVTRTIRLQGFGANNASGFDIALVFFDEAYTDSQIGTFTTAANRWSSIITSDAEEAIVDSSTYSGGACALGEPDIDVVVDDLLIFVTSFTEEVDGTLGLASPCLLRTLDSDDPNINLVGYMEFDTMDVDKLVSQGQWESTIIHEMGHVLGIGTNWEILGRLDILDYTTEDGEECRLTTGFIEPPVYTGVEGRNAYSELGGTGDVPVEEGGLPGTRCGHWDEVVFQNELMTGELNAGENPLSELSVRSLRDLGYAVDATAADPYSLPSSGALRPVSVLDIGAREILIPPRGRVDPKTGRFEPLGPVTP